MRAWQRGSRRRRNPTIPSLFIIIQTRAMEFNQQDRVALDGCSNLLFARAIESPEDEEDQGANESLAHSKQDTVTFTMEVDDVITTPAEEFETFLLHGEHGSPHSCTVVKMTITKGYVSGVQERREIKGVVTRREDVEKYINMIKDEALSMIGGYGGFARVDCASLDGSLNLSHARAYIF